VTAPTGLGSEPPRCAQRAVVACLLSFLLAFSAATAAPREAIDPALERSVKAAFLYKFLGFVEWPAATLDESAGPITIGVIGADAIAAELEQIVPGRTLAGKPIAVRRLRAADSLADIHLLFVGRASERLLAQFTQKAQRQSVLTVCESANPYARGCAINFVIAEGRVRFEVSQQTAENSGLRLSSRLLAVARNVETGRP
jgi:hypothetical protein